ncbi:MAG: hypothetical protein V4623_02885 [Pseudomonadota bacterium]
MGNCFFTAPPPIHNLTSSPPPSPPPSPSSSHRPSPSAANSLDTLSLDQAVPLDSPNEELLLAPLLRHVVIRTLLKFYEDDRLDRKEANNLAKGLERLSEGGDLVTAREQHEFSSLLELKKHLVAQGDMSSTAISDGSKRLLPTLHMLKESLAALPKQLPPSKTMSREDFAMHSMRYGRIAVAAVQIPKDIKLPTINVNNCNASIDKLLKRLRALLRYCENLDPAIKEHCRRKGSLTTYLHGLLPSELIKICGNLERYVVALEEHFIDLRQSLAEDVPKSEFSERLLERIGVALCLFPAAQLYLNCSGGCSDNICLALGKLKPMVVSARQPFDIRAWFSEEITNNQPPIVDYDISSAHSTTALMRALGLSREEANARDGMNQYGGDQLTAPWIWVRYQRLLEKIGQEFDQFYTHFLNILDSYIESPSAETYQLLINNPLMPDPVPSECASDDNYKDEGYIALNPAKLEECVRRNITAQFPLSPEDIQNADKDNELSLLDMYSALGRQRLYEALSRPKPSRKALMIVSFVAAFPPNIQNTFLQLLEIPGFNEKIFDPSRFPDYYQLICAEINARVQQSRRECRPNLSVVCNEQTIIWLMQRQADLETWKSVIWPKKEETASDNSTIFITPQVATATLIGHPQKRQVAEFLIDHHVQLSCKKQESKEAIRESKEHLMKIVAALCRAGDEDAMHALVALRTNRALAGTTMLHIAIAVRNWKFLPKVIAPMRESTLKAVLESHNGDGLTPIAFAIARSSAEVIYGLMMCLGGALLQSKMQNKKIAFLAKNAFNQQKILSPTEQEKARALYAAGFLVPQEQEWEDVLFTWLTEMKANHKIDRANYDVVGAFKKSGGEKITKPAHQQIIYARLLNTDTLRLNPSARTMALINKKTIKIPDHYRLMMIKHLLTQDKQGSTSWEGELSEKRVAWVRTSLKALEEGAQISLKKSNERPRKRSKISPIFFKPRKQQNAQDGKQSISQPLKNQAEKLQATT